MLYRGFHQKFADGRLLNPWRINPRTPQHSHILVHQIADNWFLRRFGVKARSETVICSTSLEVARSFGRNGAFGQVIPNEPYSIIYSEDVTDFLQYGTEIAELTAESVEQWLASKQFHFTVSLDDLPVGQNIEVMLDCGSYEFRSVS